MSVRLIRVLVAASLALSIGLVGAFQSTAAQGQAGGGVLIYDPPVTGMTLPAPGQAIRFSLCEWRALEADEVSKPCTQSNSGKQIRGGHNANYVFNTGRTFLPRGLTLDGFGVLSGKTDLDLSKLVLTTCVLQLNETANCQNVWFSSNKAAQIKPKGANVAGLVGLAGGVVAGGAALGFAAKKYQEGLESSGGSSSGGSSSSCSSGQPANCTSSSKCNCGFRCVTFDGAGSVGFCAK